MARTFTVAPGPHAPRLAIQAHDLTLDECRTIEAVITNNWWIDSLDYEMKRSACPFLQGYEPPHRADGTDGWMLIEFWTNDRGAIEGWVRHLERRLAEAQG